MSSGLGTIMEDKQPLVSVLISLYNVERFLLKKRLIDVREQSYSNLEIILVDDGATDNTPTIIEELAKEDSRIRTIHKKNGGLGSTRNAGLDAATGEYVYFCDVDDDIHYDLIDKCVSLMQKHQAEMLIFGFNEIYNSGKHPSSTFSFTDRVIERNSDLKRIFVDSLLLSHGVGFAWNKFYRRSFIEDNHFRFGNQYIQQDEVFNMQLYPYVNRMVISSDVLYDYYIYETGNNRSRYIPNRFEIHQSIYQRLSEIIKTWGIKDERCEEYILKKFFRGINDAILFNGFHKNNPQSYREREIEFQRILDNKDVQSCLSQVRKNYSLGLESKAYLWAYKSKNYRLLGLLRNLFLFLRFIKNKFIR